MAGSLTPEPDSRPLKRRVRVLASASVVSLGGAKQARLRLRRLAYLLTPLFACRVVTTGCDTSHATESATRLCPKVCTNGTSPQPTLDGLAPLSHAERAAEYLNG